ncbi:TfoX/Sxy family protein [Secundilactobacillus hailunensis]|uniref:TfoX/Sxy family protein n=1 Tax=Secundilactobacillus hailunensis TaxID=2559923 RepID=A0ABW1TEF6_9LACO|nr:TfoX/Sxy family protein [Secundilactobacillus hailunensis]
MASSEAFTQYIAEQFSDAGTITYKKMFGEYGLYCNGKYFASVCDDQLFVKITAAGSKIVPDQETASSYPGAKPQFLISELDNKELLCKLATATCEALPAPKPKKSKNQKL